MRVIVDLWKICFIRNSLARRVQGHSEDSKSHSSVFLSFFISIIDGI